MVIPFHKIYPALCISRHRSHFGSRYHIRLMRIASLFFLHPKP